MLGWSNLASSRFTSLASEWTDKDMGMHAAFLRVRLCEGVWGELTSFSGTLSFCSRVPESTVVLGS